ncbi:uncharacterized protein F5Z01DRAFT_667603 [Emericellopsis atlantica]|uniref:Secreted protein n=1 Tax=Emericellopsis atlantica TaxID=2614577 RepID=A0A9P7ZDF7_9HYPO|nr:uncharacterized protein F5Z01DRAFT_667603 [Emericellopsis atlantica]KAG9250029.1 hypothetical protein F5Z01DRAFT_667603 [Emericellopsis atlantica]
MSVRVSLLALVDLLRHLCSKSSQWGSGGSKEGTNCNRPTTDGDILRCDSAHTGQVGKKCELPATRRALRCNERTVDGLRGGSHLSSQPRGRTSKQHSLSWGTCRTRDREGGESRSGPAYSPL